MVEYETKKQDGWKETIRKGNHKEAQGAELGKCPARRDAESCP